MKELSLNILDIAQNSVKAGADRIDIIIDESDDSLFITIIDDGCGMDAEFLAAVTDPFTTTRTTRSVGLGIPLFKLAAEQTGGSFEITSKKQTADSSGHGTTVKAGFKKNNIDFTPLGDVISTLVTLIQGSPDIRWVYRHDMPGGTVGLDTAELKAVLGDVPLNVPDVIAWITGYLKEQYGEQV